MKIAIVNDNTKKLKMWLEILGECASAFTHPALFLHSVNKSKEIYDVIILDRIFHELDAITDKTSHHLRQSYPDAKIALSSALHNAGDKVEGFDFVLDQWPIDKTKIMEVIEQIDA